MHASLKPATFNVGFSLLALTKPDLLNRKSLGASPQRGVADMGNTVPGTFKVEEATCRVQLLILKALKGSSCFDPLPSEVASASNS